MGHAAPSSPFDHRLQPCSRNYTVRPDTDDPRNVRRQPVTFGMVELATYLLQRGASHPGLSVSACPQLPSW